MLNLALYATTVVVWGASWLAVRYQLGVVAPEVSLVYRFAVSAVLMVGWCLLSGRSLRSAPAQHGFLALQGLFLFGINYYLIYLGTQYLTTGLVAVLFSLVVAFNILGGVMVLRLPLRPRVAAGAALGLVGIAVIFWPAIRAFDLSRDGSLGIAFCIAGTISASAGMLLSGRNQRRGMSVVASNAMGMVYGSVFLSLLVLARGAPFAFDPSLFYVGSMVYLVLFATVIGFFAYLTLLGRIGADRAGYAAVMFPVVALALSTIYESFVWTPEAAVGVLLVLSGNALVLTRGAPATPRPAENPHWESS